MKKNEIIYALVKRALFDNNSTNIPNISMEQWEEVYTELVEQTISGVSAEWIFSNVTLPEVLQKNWKLQYMCQVGIYIQLLYEQNELVKLMTMNHIPMAILKGVAAAIYYPQPSMRLMGDIDFLVPREEFKRAYELMIDNGYQLKYEEDHVDYHMTLQKGAFVYEIHKEPAGMPAGEEGKFLQQLVKQGMETLDTVKVDKYEVPVLPTLQNGIVLLLHIVKHLKSGLGLRQIIDWMMYVNQELDDDTWHNEMQPVLEKTQYEKIAKIVTRMCQIYLGLGQENITWCEDIDDDICAKLMDYIMEQGNFGKKVMEEDKGVRILAQIHNPVQLFFLLQKKGEKNWDAVKKYPILRPFAWIHTCCRYVSKAVRRNSPVKTLLCDMDIANDRRKFFEEMGIYYNE